MKQPNCDDYDPNSLSVEQALQRIEQEVQAVEGIAQIPIRNALKRILAEDVLSNINIPPAPCSAMDGYAIQAADIPKQGTAQLTIVGTSFAGKPFNGEVHAGECARIFTGAVMPAGTDTVVMQEHVKVENNKIIIESHLTAGEHVRATGEDLAQGQLLLPKGKRLLPADVGLLASVGISEVKVTRRLRVAFFSTGDELCSIGQIPEPGQIYDSNRYTIYSMLTHLGVNAIDMGVIRDQPQDIERTLLSAASYNDAIITSGGVSVGDADYVTEVLNRVGKVNFWKLAMKPGRPLAFGRVNNALFFGLPGNPVAVMSTFYEFVQLALRRMMGQTIVTPVRFKVPCISGLKKKPGRMEFQRGILENNAQGQLVVRSTGKQGSAMLSSMSHANCFIILPLDCGNVEPGTEVLVEPFEGVMMG